MSTATQAATGGISFMGMLTILFICLKLTGTITWSWWLVLLPVTWPLIVVGIIISLAGIAMIFGWENNQ